MKRASPRGAIIESTVGDRDGVENHLRTITSREMIDINGGWDLGAALTSLGTAVWAFAKGAAAEGGAAITVVGTAMSSRVQAEENAELRAQLAVQKTLINNMYSLQTRYSSDCGVRSRMREE